MDKTTIKTEIIRYLEASGPKFGGQIEDYIRQTGAKSSNTSRRCRELVNSGILERELVKVEGVPNKVVRYRVKPYAEPVETLCNYGCEHPFYGKNNMCPIHNQEEQTKLL